MLDRSWVPAGLVIEIYQTSSNQFTSCMLSLETSIQEALGSHLSRDNYLNRLLLWHSLFPARILLWIGHGRFLTLHHSSIVLPFDASCSYHRQITSKKRDISCSVLIKSMGRFRTWRQARWWITLKPPSVWSKLFQSYPAAPCLRLPFYIPPPKVSTNESMK
jgi:hypothetical protein